MKIIYALFLFVGYLSMFSAVIAYTSDFPSDVIMKVFFSLGIVGYLLVLATQNQLQRNLTHAYFSNEKGNPGWNRQHSVSNYESERR